MKRFIFCLFFLAVFASVSFASEDIIDLGEVGFSCSLEHGKNKKGYPAISSNALRNTRLNTVSPSYRSNLVKHTGSSKLRHSSFKKNLNISAGTRIFVFSCYDTESIKIASELDFNYGLCIEYKSLDDIDNFRRKTGIKQPVQIANDEMVRAFSITSYPALITVKQDEFQIQEGF